MFSKLIHQQIKQMKPYLRIRHALRIYCLPIVRQNRHQRSNKYQAQSQNSSTPAPTKPKVLLNRKKTGASFSKIATCRWPSLKPWIKTIKKCNQAKIKTLLTISANPRANLNGQCLTSSVPLLPIRAEKIRIVTLYLA